MSSWSRSSYSAPAEAADGWQTVTPRATRTWGSSAAPAAGAGQRAWPSSAGAGAGGGDMPSAFMKKPRGDDRPPRRQTEEEARRDYVMKLAAEKAVKEAAQAKQLADTQDNFPSLGAGAAAKPKKAAPPTTSWATQIKNAGDENEQKRRAAAAEEAANKLSEGITVLRLGSRKEMREPFFTTGQAEKEADFHNNEILRSSIWDDRSNHTQSETLRRACFSSSIIAEQEKYDYNRATGYGEDDLDDGAPPHRYSPHSPPYSPTCHEEDEE